MTDEVGQKEPSAREMRTRGIAWQNESPRQVTYAEHKGRRPGWTVRREGAIRKHRYNRGDAVVQEVSMHSSTVRASPPVKKNKESSEGHSTCLEHQARGVQRRGDSAGTHGQSQDGRIKERCSGRLPRAERMSRCTECAYKTGQLSHPKTK